MPKDDIKALYDRAEQHLKARQRPRRDTIVDAAVPPLAPNSAPAPEPKVTVPRPTPKKPEPPPAPELLSEPEHTPLPSFFPESEVPTAAISPEARRKKEARRREEFRKQAPVSEPLSEADARSARKARGWDPPHWLVAIAKWAAPPVMLCLMAGAYWFQAVVTLKREQADALSEIRKQKDEAYAKMKKDLAELEEKLGKAQAERDSARAAVLRQKFLCSQGALKVTKETEEKQGE